MLVTRTARKHGITAELIRGVLAAPLCRIVQGDRVLHIGLAPSRDLIEVVVAAGDQGPVIVHAMRLRPANYGYLRPSRPGDDGRAQ